MPDRSDTANGAPPRLAARALAVAVMLAAVAGFVDAVGFNRIFGVFAANQSGNVAFLGMAIGGDAPVEGWRAGLSIGWFAAGAAAGFGLGRRLGSRKGPTLLTTELVLLGIVSLVLGTADGRPPGGVSGVALVALGSFAMGVQTEAIRHVAGIAVATTYQSGAVARIGETIGNIAGARRHGSTSPLPVLGAVLVAYCTGAAVGATEPGRIGVPLAAPMGALAALVTAWLVAPRWFTEIDAA